MSSTLSAEDLSEAKADPTASKRTDTDMMKFIQCGWGDEDSRSRKPIPYGLDESSPRPINLISRVICIDSLLNDLAILCFDTTETIPV
jgi:hypothetical protein